MQLCNLAIQFQSQGLLLDFSFIQSTLRRRVYDRPARSCIKRENAPYHTL
jgi:hypothetical protein